MSLLSPPFYFLNPIRDYILTHAEPITAANCLRVVVVPFLPLWPQAYLLCCEGTRPYRAAIGAVGVALIAHTWSHYRFYELHFDAFNNGLLIAAIHLGLKYIEFGTLAAPIQDPWPARPTWLSAFDLCANSRMVGLGSVGLDTVSGPANVPRHAEPERWLPRPHTGRTRARALARHATRAAIGYVVLDGLLALLRLTGGDTLGRTGYTPNAFAAFSHSHRFTILPSGINYEAPHWLVELTAEASVPVVIWAALHTGYHIFGALALASGVYEVDAWEVDLMGNVFRADSIMDLWGRKWHQLMSLLLLFPFTPHAPPSSLADCAGRTRCVVALPMRPWSALRSVPRLPPLQLADPGTSGTSLFHALGELGMSTPPSPPKIILFFLLSGVGAALEVAFKTFTGRRVAGWPGRVWAWAYMLAIGRLACAAWLDAGMAACKFLPEHGPGERVARALVGTLIGVDT
ncbi:hypothetical protein Q5752_005516 [Cryptotrichosporon argae]